MKTEILESYLRQSPDRKNGKKGCWCVRLYVTDNVLKSRRIELGLGTSDKAEALTRTRLIVTAFMACKVFVTNRRVLMELKKGGFVPIEEVGQALYFPPDKKVEKHTTPEIK